MSTQRVRNVLIRSKLRSYFLANHGTLRAIHVVQTRISPTFTLTGCDISKIPNCGLARLPMVSWDLWYVSLDCAGEGLSSEEGKGKMYCIEGRNPVMDENNGPGCTVPAIS